MNSNIGVYIGGLVVWLLSGFTLTFREAIGRDYKEALNFKYLPYKITVRIIGIIVVLIMIYFIGLLLRAKE